jgi:L-2-hydroxycarboxylate dehydrogenase (NAD+)
VNIAAARAEGLARRILEAEGVAAEPAGIQARWLVEAELRGHPSHGLQRLPMVVQRIRSGVSSPNAAPVVSWSTPACATVDGAGGLGPVVMRHVAALTAGRAREHGIALAAVSNANHLGLLALYVEELARDGLLAILTTVSEALVHPHGGAEALVGTNPLAVGVPAEPEPFVLDMATSATSMGRVLNARRTGAALQDGWAVDAAGRSTTDADAAVALSPFGGAKGYALGLALELIVGTLTASALGRAVTGTLDAESVCNKGDVLICVDPGRLAQPPRGESVSAYLEAIRHSLPTDGEGPVAVPGDRARERKRRRLDAGLDLPDSLWAELEALNPNLMENPA